MPQPSAFLRIFAAALCALALTACGASGRRGLPADTLIVVESGDTGSLNPLYTNQAFGFIDESQIFEPLVNIGKNFSIVPWLATSWRSTADQLHWTFQLRRGVRWSDGAPFTAKDVEFTWRVMLDPATAFPYAGQFSFVKKVAAAGAYVVRVDLSATNALFLSGAMNSPILPEHILGKVTAAQQHGTNFGEHPVGTGPFMLESWQHDQEMTLVANPYWWHGRPRIKRIAIQVLINEQARVEAMQDGSADFYDNMGSSDYLTLRENPRLRTLHLNDLYTYFIYTNEKREIQRDNRVRQAMLYGWDRAALVAGLLHGDARVATGVVPSILTDWYEPRVRRYDYDPARARSLLDAAGWHVARDGIRTRAGKRLALVLKVPNGSDITGDVVAAFQADMQQIGIKVDVSLLDYATFINQTNAGDFDLAYSGWGGVPDPDQFSLLQSKQIPPTGNNQENYSDATVDKDVTLGLQAIDPAKRKPYYQEMQRATAENLPVLFGYEVFYRAAFSKRVQVDTAKLLPDQYVWLNLYDWSLSP